MSASLRFLLVLLLVASASLLPAAAQVADATADTAAAAPDTAATPDTLSVYAIQLRASEDSTLIAGLLDSLRQAAVPAYVTATEAEGKTYRRLRIGPFTSRQQAEAFAAFHGYDSDAWIGNAAGDRAAFSQVVAQVWTDALGTQRGPLYYYLGRQHPLIGVLQPRTGPGGALLTAELRLYVEGRARPVLLENITGFAEAPGGVEFGQAERVFVNPRGRPVADFEEDVRDFARMFGVSRYVIEENLSYFDDGVAARFTVLGAYDLAHDTVQTFAQPGFDYARISGSRERFRGRVRGAQTFRKGNALARRVSATEPTAGGNAHAAFYARPTERGAAVELCLLQLRPVAPGDVLAAE